MRIIERRRGGAAIALALVAALALLGCAAPSGRDDAYRQAIDEIRTRYVEAIDEKQLHAGSLKGILNGLDPHSDYLGESEYREVLADARGEYSGIGVQLSDDEDRLTIVATLEGAPAERAGLRPGDIIAMIDGEGVATRAAIDAFLRMRGPAGTTVRLRVARNGRAPFDVSITRAVIPDRSVMARLEPGRIGYVRVAAFCERTEAELVDVLDLLHRKAGGRLTGLVLDLRGNPGGLLDAAVSVAADFLDGGTIVMTRGRDPAEDTRYEAAPGGDLTDGTPMVLLIDGGSASGAEIVAGALQDHGRALLIGSRSFGKGSVQTLIAIPGHGAVQLTTARYYTPSGRSIQAQGIAPDREVATTMERKPSLFGARREADLPHALGNTGPIGAAARTGASRSRDGDADPEEHLTAAPATIGAPGDRQLAAAVALLRERSRPIAAIGSRSAP
jgi:carboxyl-terminal processing protease